ncbi:MAG: polysaccharide biosynthesis tyrosine autokinase, partial [Cyanobacteriota bacterium]|nr:polysaccharide biosynthesis tyrosine autokinase [Cyanobacteriota bacterium]
MAALPTPQDPGDEIDPRELWRALRRRKRLVFVTAAAVVAVAALVTTHQRLFRPVYEGGFQLLISDPVSDSGRGGGAEAAAGTPFEELALNRTQSDLPTLIEVLESPLLLNPVAKRHDLTAAGLAGRITIASGGTRQQSAQGVLKVSLTGGDPIQDQVLLNDLAQAYLHYSLSQRQQRLAEGLKFLDRQAPALQQRTNELQGELALFRRTHNLLEPKEEGAALKSLASSAEQQVRDLMAERSRLQAARAGVLNGTLSARGFQEAIGTGSSNRTAAGSQGVEITVNSEGLLQQLGTLENQIADARSRYSAGSSMLQGLEARRRSLLPVLQRNQLEAIDAALALNQGRLVTARSQQGQLDARFLRQPALIKQYDELLQKLSIAQDNLAGLIKAKENFQLEIAQRTVPWTVIAEPEVNPTPVKPSVPRNLALGVVLGLVAGAGAGLLRDRLDHVFHTPGEVTDDLRQPLLGHVPYVPFFQGVRQDKRFLIEELDRSGESGSEAGMSGYQRFYYQEAFRNLYTSLRFLNTGRPLKSVAITSALPAEGKSLVNVLLAKTLAEMGQRVLLVDADLRKPQMHHRLGLNNLLGLTNLLTEDGLHWHDIVQPVKGYEGWSVLTAGRVPPDPARLLSSHRMRDLVRELSLSGQFDLIVYDTPPMLGLADAALVAEHLDGLMLLVSLDRVDRGLPKEAISRIRSSGAALLGIVTNAVKEEHTRAGGSYGYGYGYGYGKYGYGYGRYGYNYGYAAYNPGTAYSYYSQDAPTDAAEDRSSAGRALQPSAVNTDKKTPAQRLLELRRSIVRWLD